MNPVVTLMYNTTDEQLELSKKALASVINQDLEDLWITVINNGSTPATQMWLDEVSQKMNCILPRRSFIEVHHYEENISPLRVSNNFLRDRFDEEGTQYVLGVPNDVILAPSTYRLMLEWPRGFVSATDNGQCDLSILDNVTSYGAVSECTPMAVMLTRKWAYDALVAKDGYFFDEGMFHYASDCDMALRMAACGIRGVQIDLPFWHFGSASWRLAKFDVSREITSQADVDRAYFERKWGFRVDDPEYGQRAADINFRG